MNLHKAVWEPLDITSQNNDLWLTHIGDIIELNMLRKDEYGFIYMNMHYLSELLSIFLKHA